MPHPRLRSFDSVLISMLIFSVITVLCARFSTVSAQDNLTPVEDSVQGGGSHRSAVIYVIPSVNYKMIHVPPRTFLMGSPSTEKGRYDDEEQHPVTLTNGFYIGVTEVTQGQWKKIMGNNPSHFKECGDNCPVEQVTWSMCREFIMTLNRKEKTRRYRLPTEAEWEYACRAGSSLAFANGDITEIKCGHDPNLDKIGWYCGNTGVKTQEVAKKIPNPWGLYDMHGNAWEWCQDRYDRYRPGHTVDPEGPDSGASRIFRGGGWGLSSRTCRSAFRDKYDPTLKCRFLGFRLVREARNP
ncbi:MAG: formylglycine-generating enzyme family protein [Deltaproteobacteria bacterium]|nr:formylglycine-generating enzyme family protein [Deltaproteobacteria bacterium]